MLASGRYRQSARCDAWATARASGPPPPGILLSGNLSLLREQSGFLAARSWRAIGVGLQCVLFTLLTLGACAKAWAGVCAGAAPTAPVPAEFLRSYRAFLTSPTRLAIDDDDNVYITDPLSGRIVVRAADGRVRLDVNTVGNPISIAVDSAGSIYVGDGTRRRVDIYDPTGNAIGFLGQGDDEFVLPAFLAVHEDETQAHIYVVDSGADRVKRYAADTGAFELEFGGSGSEPGDLIFPSGIAIADGRIHLVDRGNSRLQIFDSAGVFQEVIEPEPDDCGFLCFFEGDRRGRARDAGLWIGLDGALYLAQASKGEVQVLSGTGDALGTVGSFGSTPGKLRVPSDVAIDSCGRLFIASAANGRVDIFGLPGYSDPEQFVPARVRVAKQPVDPLRDAVLVAYLEVPGYRLSEVENLLANGVSAPLATVIGDADRDNLPDLRLEFGAELLATLGAEETAKVSVTGSVGGLQIEASVWVQVLVTNLDTDSDGVNDSDDACPATRAGGAVDGRGCSVSQHCPCAGPAPDASWNNHGAYVFCVATASRRFVVSGFIEQHEHGRIMKHAASSKCGNRRRTRK